MKKRMFLICFMFYFGLHPYTLVVIGKSNKTGWFAEAREKVYHVQRYHRSLYREALLEEREHFEIWPSKKFKERDFDEYYKTYSLDYVARLLCERIEELHKKHEKINIVCYGYGSVVASLALVKLSDKLGEIPDYLKSDITGDNEIPDSPHSCLGARGQEIHDILTRNDKISDKVLNPKIELAGKVTIAICGATVTIVTLVIAPIISAVIIAL